MQICMRVCVRPKTSGVILTLYDPFYGSFFVDVIDSRGLSNEIHRQLQPKKTKVMVYYPFI